MRTTLDDDERRSGPSLRRDVVTGGVVFAAILLFVGTAGRLVSDFVDLIEGVGAGADNVLATAVLLNVALLLFGWRRYRDLTHEVAERAQAEERAQTLASKDPLTGFLNRRSLSQGGALLIAEGIARNKLPVLMMIDLDHFKTVNDLHGHVTGDKLLRATAEAIRAALPVHALTARLGGDEFACIFLADAANPLTVDAIADAIIARLAQPFDLDGVYAHVSASLGIARREEDCTTIEALMRRADIAMYAAKKSGRNRLAWFDASMERELQVRNELEAGLRTGIPRGEIVPFYEQQIDLETGVIHGFEVLARWRHPTRGIIMPDLFIPVAEDTGMIGDLSMSVMRQAFEEAKSWDQSLTLSVNISPAQLKDPWLAQKIVKLLVETGYPANRLEIEITESSLFENLGLAQSIVGSLKNQGIRLALDDFGTGYSSLAHLRALPFDRIKIDRSFVTSIVENSESAAIVDAITKLGGSLGLPITAEGIENGTIEARLRSLGCHKGQGYHFGRPLDVTDVRKLLADRALLPTARSSGTDEEPAPRKKRARG